MNALKIILFLFLSAIAGCNNGPKTANNITNDNPDKGFALLELFTSEGCSSCPPADKLLARIQQEAGNRPVYLLCEHVDYWDHLGWKDAFSQHQFTQRQFRYDSILKAQVYTPQLIINGKTECLGSDKAAVTKAVNNALAKKSDATLDLKAMQHGKEMEISYQVNGDSANGNLLIAVVQKQAVRQIGDGENRGRTLHHAQIVRSLFSFPVATNSKGVEQIELPDDYQGDGYQVIGFLQDAKTNAILIAVRAD